MRINNRSFAAAAALLLTGNFSSLLYAQRYDSDGYGRNTGAASSGGHLQYYADQCSPALPNNGTSDDAANLRTCMAAMPAGATMNLDGAKPYYFASYTYRTPYGGNGKCGIYVGSNRTLKLNEAAITLSPRMITNQIFAVCAGVPSGGNTPLNAFGATGSFLQINDTVAGAQSVTIASGAAAPNNSGSEALCSGIACASLIHEGDYLYLDCGVNAVPPNGDVDIFVGWNQASANGNSSTGVIPLVYPMGKAYTAAECASGNPRIYDYTTGGVTSVGGYGGPLAHDISIEGPGSISGAANSPILIEGTVGFDIGYIKSLDITSPPGNGFLFANNNHLGRVHDNRLGGNGCTGDTDLNAGEFTSSFNTIDHNKYVATGAGCSSSSGNPRIAVEGDSEGDEYNHYSYNRIQILGNGSPSASSSTCQWAVNTWHEAFDHDQCKSAYNGFLDPPNTGGGPASGAGPVALSNNTYTVQGAGLILSGPKDQSINNIINEEGASSNAIEIAGYFPAIVIGGTVNIVNQIAAVALYAVSPYLAYDSVIERLSINCPAGDSCASNAIGIAVADPGTTVRQPLTLIGNVTNGITHPIHYDGSAVAHLPKMKVQVQPGRRK